MYYFKDNAFYHPAVHDPIPAGAVEVTDEDHGLIMIGISNGDILSTDGGGNPVLTPPAAISLADRQLAARIEIDGHAEAARMRYVTNGAGQAMIYQVKGEQAEAFVAAGYPVDLTPYPLIQAEVNATSKTATQAADDIIAQKTAWVLVGASIEEARLGGKIAVDAAVDDSEVETARDAAIAVIDLI